MPYTPIWGTYAFADVTASISGPGGAFTIAGPDTAVADEAITIVPTSEETNTQSVGADGSVMNSLHSSRAGTVTFRVQKISPVNQALAQLYAYQRQSSALWGRNTITVRDVARGDQYTLLGCAFVRNAQNAYAKAGNTLEWEMHVAVADGNLGPGTIDGH